MSVANAPPADAYTIDGRSRSAWTGTYFIVLYRSGASFLGKKYKPADDTWTDLTMTNAPEARDRFGAFWTGAKLGVWGGWGNTSPGLSTGGIYDPSSDTWAEMTNTSPPSARGVMPGSEIWTGSQFFVWGSCSVQVGGSGCLTTFNTGGHYIPTQ